jgi:hypothetical protein
MQFVIHIDLESDALLNTPSELGRILRDAANFADADYFASRDSLTLRDINGNGVGTAKIDRS